MNPEVKELWAQALESGNYIKAIGMYKSYEGPDTFCSLGVLMDLYNKKIGLTEENEWMRVTSSRCGEFTEWAGFTTNDFPKLSYLDKQVHIFDLNDRVNLPFPEIAKLIREQL